VTDVIAFAPGGKHVAVASTDGKALQLLGLAIFHT
jgi:hypothetical protein